MKLQRLLYFTHSLLLFSTLAACSSTPKHVPITDISSFNHDTLQRQAIFANTTSWPSNTNNYQNARQQNTEPGHLPSSSYAYVNKNAHAAPSYRDLFAKAKSYLGVPYRYGGNGYSGIDCSALIVNSFKAIGVNLPRTSKAQAQQGAYLDDDELRKGDLVFFSTDNNAQTINHVGLMLDERSFIHASSSRGVIVSKLDNSYWSRNYKFSKRIIE